MQEQKEEKLIDLKGTLKQLVETDEPELSQEEAIMEFGEPKKKKNNNNDADDGDVTEELEHLRRIKKELLASLKRVEKLEEELFKKHEEKLKLNVKASKNGGFLNSKQIEQQKVEKQNQKERE